jgi:dienelactone hydrolase
MKINANYVLKEPDYGTAPLPDDLDLILNVNGDKMLGEIYLPSGIFEAPHPCVIVCHGIPGTNCNDDICQSLRRMGCVVIRLYHRGAWGSDGTYSFTHCMEDAKAAAHWAHDTVAAQYGIDTERIFLLGHSNGGNTVLNVTPSLPFIRGTIAYSPFDHKTGLALLKPEGLREMYKECGQVLHFESLDALYEDSVSHAEAWSFPTLAKKLASRNLLLIGGLKDAVAPPGKMVDPLWKALQKYSPSAIQQRVMLDSNHSMDTTRLELIRIIGKFVEKVCEMK